jgi:hypothetical protein
MTPSMDHIQTSELLASASQTLARELSRQTRSASATVQSFPDAPPPPPVPASMPTVTKKPSRWKLSFGKSSGEAAMSTRSDSQSSNPISNRTRHVTNVLMGLDSPSTHTSPPLPSPPPPPVSPPVIGSSTWTRGEHQLQPQQWCATSPTSIHSGRAAPSILSSSASDNWWSSMSSIFCSVALVFRIWEGPNWCASVMHSPFLFSRGCWIHMAEPLVLYFMLSALKMVDLWSIVGG